MSGTSLSSATQALKLLLSPPSLPLTMTRQRWNGNGGEGIGEGKWGERRGKREREIDLFFLELVFQEEDSLLLREYINQKQAASGLACPIPLSK